MGPPVLISESWYKAALDPLRTFMIGPTMGEKREKAHFGQRHGFRQRTCMGRSVSRPLRPAISLLTGLRHLLFLI
jgi:hypothetical protein